MTMIKPEESPLFQKWTDPVSGVESYIRAKRVAPLQKAYYYLNSGLVANGRYLWFECAFPPSPGRLHAVADILDGTVQVFHETQHAYCDPYVCPESGDMYWATETQVWKRGPRAGEDAVLVNSLPADLVRGRKPRLISTHLSLCADGRSVSIDANFGSEWIIGDLPLDGSDFRLWQSFDRCYTHAQFSPTDPDLMLIMQDSWHDPVSGLVNDRADEDRLWLIRRGGRAYQILPNDPLRSANRGHEWWDAGGRHVWFLDYTEGPKQGTKKVCLDTGEVTVVWPRGRSHSHCDRSGRYFVGDIVKWPDDAWEVAFYNSVTGVDVPLVKLLPPCNLRRAYHVHPHPHFCLDDRYICYTTNVLGRVDLALTPVEALLERTS